MKAKTIIENNDVKCITTECTVSEFFAIQTAIRIALKSKILPDEDRQILEEIIKVKPKFFE